MKPITIWLKPSSKSGYQQLEVLADADVIQEALRNIFNVAQRPTPTTGIQAKPAKPKDPRPQGGHKLSELTCGFCANKFQGCEGAKFCSQSCAAKDRALEQRKAASTPAPNGAAA